MSRILCVALAGHGHVTPMLPIVGELVRRGHDVAFACGPEHADAVTRGGATWVELPGLPPFVPPAEVGPDAVLTWLRHFFGALARTYPVLLAHARERRPDVVVYDATNWPGRLAAHAVGVPAVRTVPNLAENEHWRGIDHALFAGLHDHPEAARLGEDVAAFAREHGVELDVAATLEVVEDLNLVFVPRTFQPAGDTFDDRFLFLGPVVGERGEEPFAPPVDDLPLVYVSLGSIFTGRPDVYRACRDAFADGRYAVRMTVGDVDPASLGPLPATMEVAAWSPQLAVLRHAAAFVTHAGMNSTMEAIHHGVPMVALPQMPEQVVNADRVAELDLGRRLAPDGVTAGALRAAVDDVTTSVTVRAAVAAMREDAARGGGAVAGADAIVHVLGLPGSSG
ncbi:macrolide family glycosyltransferase [Actinomycetospora straminea]|uniref:Glycosyltransferase n=1 Tax=Actinomycetospora straminea TaxID=663607 RepID=A0ABP9F3N9_9PSEU|nr:macrolide family glycosyltransferase [Actinomycetospora straminea]MDD7936100.1 glycosyltransferase [Actinomycetospora straminea]